MICRTVVNTVDAVMHHTLESTVVAYQVVVVIIINRSKRIDEVPPSVPSVYPFVFRVEIKVLERYLFVILYRCVDFVYRVEDAFVCALGRVELYNIAPQEFGTVATTEVGYLV